MSDPVIIATIGALPPTLLGTAILIQVIRRGRASHREHKTTAEKIDVVHDLANSRLSTALDQIAALKKLLGEQGKSE